MLRQARSRSTGRNPELSALRRRPAERNTQWSERVVKAMSKSAAPDQSTYIALFGGSDTLSFRLRVAQSHLRDDMLPSFWSDSALIELNDTSLAGAFALHVPLLQPQGPEFASNYNGVVRRPFADFDDVGRFPNIALIALPVPQARIAKRVEDFRHARSTLDALEHLLRWLAFSWGVARTANPLHENYGLPSACMLETACAAEDFDLTPGLESRASCPEAIWTAALRWHEYFQQTSANRRAPVGRYWIPHTYPINEPTPGQPRREGRRPRRR